MLLSINHKRNKTNTLIHKHTHTDMGFEIGPNSRQTEIKPKTTMYMVGTNTNITQARFTYATHNKFDPSTKATSM